MRLLTESEVQLVSGAMNMMVLEPLFDTGGEGMEVGFYRSPVGTWYLTLSKGGNAPFAQLNIGTTATCLAIGKGIGVVVAPGTPLASAIVSFAISNACKWGLQDYYQDANDGDG